MIERSMNLFPNITNKKISFKKLSSFYANVTVMSDSGFSLGQIFLNFSKTEPNAIHREQFKIIAHQLNQGQNVVNTLRRIQLLPEFDIPLIKAAIDMGRVPQLMKKLLIQYDQLYTAIQEIKSQLFQPIFTLLMAIFIKDFAALMSSQMTTTQYLLRALPALTMLFGGGLLFFWVWSQSQYLKKFRQSFYGTFAWIPGIDRYILLLAIQRFSLALELALETGMDLYQSLEMAGDSSGYEKVTRANKRLIPMIQQGVGLETAIAVENVFPKEFVMAISIGINSGSLPETIGQYRKRLELEIANTRNFIVKMIPRIIQIAVAVYVASMIVNFYADSLKALE